MTGFDHGVIGEPDGEKSEAAVRLSGLNFFR